MTDDPAELLTDPEAARLLRVGITTLFELQKRPDFPPAIWLGPRLKRRERARLLEWALSQREKPAEVPA
ncbi:MAG: hypothetical protein MUC86_04990 [Burkholderiaceae bacterium]|jgi:predicted DNA-binding transcriptional regulator AlpA|nr:hypothetical protein [Burkholderiaceae bacterium]